MNDIINLLESRGTALDAFEIAEILARDTKRVAGELNELASTGRVILTKKGRYMLPEAAGLVSAKTLILKSGAPAARPLDGSPDMLIRERGNMRPMVGDLILVRPEPYAGDGMGQCALMSITKRAHESFMAVLTMAHVELNNTAPRGRNQEKKRSSSKAVRASYVPEFRPVDPKLRSDIELEGGLMGARSGDLVQLRVTGWPERGVKLRAVIERVMGDSSDIRVQLAAIAANHSLRQQFAPDVLEQARALPDALSEADIKGRLDLRGLTLFTIDGADAQDFDDAISLERTDDGWKLGVHIADVSHYVKRKAPIDREALERGTSVYLPGLTLPMLPEQLSNHMCSLMPNADRLAMSLIMEVQAGKVTDHELFPSIIHSRARLTYEDVNLMLSGEPNGVPGELHGVLRSMVELAHALRERRHARGSIDFDMPEAAFTLDADGNPTDVRARVRGESERMIEDFMLLANETVAELARGVSLPLLYRVHAKPDPDRVHVLETFLAGLGIHSRLGAEPLPSKFQKILTDTAEKPEAALIKQVMLRSLRRAEYSPEPEGHFGLAARDYCHFTSPIRRYPDLEVHRMLKLLISGGDYSKFETRMPELAKQCSICEQQATLAERDADDLLKAHYMASRIGERYDGLVTGVTAWGAYVSLENTVEGLVPVRTLEGFYVLNQERHELRNAQGHTIRLGDRVSVIVESVSTQLAQIDFRLD